MSMSKMISNLNNVVASYTECRTKHSYNTTNAVNAPRNTQGAHTLQEGKHRVYTTNDEG